MTKLMASASAVFFLTAGTAAAHTADTAHSHNEVIIAVAALAILGAVATKFVVRSR